MNTKRVYILLLTVLLLASPAGLASASTDTIVAWHGSTMQQGLLYRLPGCNPANPDAPCYVTVTGTAVRGAKARRGGGVTPMTGGTDTLRCTVEVQNFYHDPVARLWQDVNVTWTSTQYSTANWASYDKWAAFLYEWRNVFGSSFSSPQIINYYLGGSTFSAGGDLYYLGNNYGNHRVDLSVTGDQQWSCSGH
jgi:hypothetical protein